MPVYEYACEKCGHEFEVEQRISDDPVKTCPMCRARKVKRLISRTSFVLKGSGWYSDLLLVLEERDAKGEPRSPTESGAASRRRRDGDKPTKAERGRRGRQGRERQAAKPSRLTPARPSARRRASRKRRRRPLHCPRARALETDRRRRPRARPGDPQGARRGGRAPRRGRTARPEARRRAGRRRPGERLVHQGQAPRLREPSGCDSVERNLPATATPGRGRGARSQS